jgi:hypothetical protein
MPKLAPINLVLPYGPLSHNHPNYHTKLMQQHVTKKHVMKL